MVLMLMLGKYDPTHLHLRHLLENLRILEESELKIRLTLSLRLNQERRLGF